ncbi:MAG: hypothetical protein ACRDDY_13790 [Clostridium sp.]|uniref:hypothetical protein n=1 Tax=Clostridium sp. TaxID=1506 RepID=UPI003EE57BA4
MPKIFVEIPDHGNTVRRASMLSVVQNTLVQLGIDSDYLHFTDFDDNKAQPNTQIGEATKVAFGTEQRISVEIEEQRDTFNLIDRAIGYKFELPILHDPVVGIRATPAHARHNVTVNMSVRFQSRGAASEWLNTMHRRTAMYGDVFETEATFFYVVPDEVITVAKAMYLTGAKRVTPTETFDEYLKRIMHKNVTTTTTDTGSADCMVVRCTLGRINVIMEGLGEIRADKDETNATYTARVSYKFNIGWPEGMAIDYPCTVNNSIIPEFLWHVTELPATVNIESYQKDDMVYAQDKFTTHHEYIPLPIVTPPVGMPTFMTEHRSPTEKEVIVAFLEFGEILPAEQPDLSAATDKFICNLADFEEIEFTKETLDYIRMSYAKDPTGGDSLFKAYIYAFRRPLYKAIHIDQDLNVWVKGIDVDLTEEYRFVITIDTSTDKTTPYGRLSIASNIGWFLKYVTEFHPIICIEYPWLFPGWEPNDNIAGGGLYPVLTGDNRNSYYPDIFPWNDQYVKPKWPDDYVHWWEIDGITRDKSIVHPDGSVDVDFNPDWPGWDDIIDEIGKLDDVPKTKQIHLSSIIVRRQD